MKKFVWAMVAAMAVGMMACGGKAAGGGDSDGSAEADGTACRTPDLIRLSAHQDPTPPIPKIITFTLLILFIFDSPNSS